MLVGLHFSKSLQVWQGFVSSLNGLVVRFEVLKENFRLPNLRVGNGVSHPRQEVEEAYLPARFLW